MDVTGARVVIFMQELFFQKNSLAEINCIYTKVSSWQKFVVCYFLKRFFLKIRWASPC